MLCPVLLNMIISPLDASTGGGVLFLLVLVFFLSWVSGINCIEKYSVIFLKSYLVFILVIALLGLYEYFKFVLSGVSSGMLIPYLLPHDHSLRVGGIYGQPNFFALVLVTGLLAYSYHYVHVQDFKLPRFKLLSYLPLLVVSVVFFLTDSRAGQLSLLVMCLFLGWLLMSRRYPAKDQGIKKDYFLLALIVAIGAFLAVLLNQYYAAQDVRTLAESSISIDTRFMYWAAAVLMFLDHPWLGVGFDRFQYYLPQYMNSAHDLLGFVEYESMRDTSWAHNELLQLLCENGAFVFVICLLLVVLLLWQFWRFARGYREWTPFKLYSHLMVFPFVLHSMFSWPMRHPATLILFVTFLGILLAQYSVKSFVVTGRALFGLKLVAGLSLALLGYICVLEVRMEDLRGDIARKEYRVSMPKFEALTKSAYAESPLLEKLTPRYVLNSVKEDDTTLSRWVLPYAKRLVELRGTHWQWYNLGILEHHVGNEKGAKAAIAHAIDLFPVEQTYWAYQHYMNMLDAAKETGRPFEEFLPLPKEGSPEDLKEMYDFDRVQFDIEKL